MHINAGAAGLVLALVLGKRKGWPTTPMRPHNLPFVMLGAGLLWFGWYGFNAGSAPARAASPASTFVTTTVATAAAMLAWLLVEKIRDGHATSLGAASGIVAGLVAITPSCSSVNVLGALVDRRSSRGVAVCAGCRPEVQVRLRRLARRGRRAPGRWPHGHPADRLLRGAGGARRRRRPVLRRRLWTSCGARRSARSRFSPTRPSLRLSWRYILKFTIGLRLGEEDEVDWHRRGRARRDRLRLRDCRWQARSLGRHRASEE